MARQFSAALIGQQIDAIYHTSVVFNNVEYFFGQGIHRKIPGTTHHGQPMKVINLGTTQLSMDVINEYIESLESIYTPESYDLFVHNCNNFSQDLSMFLVGKSIPEEITSLPETFLRTPMGQMLRGQIDQSMRTMTQAPDAVAGSNAPRQTNGHVPSSRTNGALRSTTNANGPAPSTKPAFVNSQVPASTPGHVYGITSMGPLNNLLSRASKSSAVIFFTSATCPPCKLLYPTFDELAESTSEDKCIFIKVDVSQAYDIGSKYSIRATPTFITFLKGQKLDEWKGADNAALRGNVRLLLQMAAPSYRHMNLDCSTFSHLITTPITFQKPPPLDKLLPKLAPHDTKPSIQALAAHIRAFTADPSNAPLPDLQTLTTFLVTTYPTIPSTTQFALVDLIRTAAIDPRISAYLTTNSKLLTTLLTHPTWHTAPYNLRLVTCQLACNLFSTPVFQESLSSNTPFFSLLSTLAASSLLPSDPAPKLVQAAAALVYNISALNHNERIQSKGDRVPLSEDVEAALVSAVYEENKDRDTLRALLLALGMVLFAGEEGGGCEGLCEAMELSTVLKDKVKSDVGKGEGLLREVQEMLSKK